MTARTLRAAFIVISSLGVPITAAAIIAMPVLSAFGSPQLSAVPTPRRIKDVKPVYPRESLQAGDEGTVRLELSIDASGTIEAVRILWSGCRRLEQAAVSAAGQWQFEEVRVNGEPTPFKMVADVPFRLPAAFKARAGRSGACRWTPPPNPIR